MVEGKKISELGLVTNINDNCCFPLLSNGATKRITFAVLLENILAQLTIPENQEIKALKEKVNNLDSSIELTDREIEIVKLRCEEIQKDVNSQDEIIVKYVKLFEELKEAYDRIEAEGMIIDDELNVDSEHAISNKAVAQLIPVQASEQNKLADKNYVDNEIDEINEKLETKVDKETFLLIDCYDENNITTGYFVLNGELKKDDYWCCTDFIPCQVEDIIHGNSSNNKDNLPMISIYDENKNWLEDIFDDAIDQTQSGKCIVSNAKAKYFKMNICSAWYGTSNKYNFAVIERGRKKGDEIEIIVDKNADDSNILICSTFWKGMLLAYTLGNCTVKVKGGKHDLFNELPTNLINTLTHGTSNNIIRGLFIGRNIRLIGEGRPLISFRNTNQAINIRDNFSILNTTGNCYIEGVDFECENIRYCIHDDLPVFYNELIARNEYPYELKVEIIDCNMKHYGTTSTTYTSSRCIGGGTAGNSKHIIRGGHYYTANTKIPISYHNQGFFPSRVDEVYIENVTFSDDNCFNVYGLDPNGSIVYFYLKNNNFSKPVVYTGTKSRTIVKDLGSQTKDLTVDEYFFTGKYLDGSPIYAMYATYPMPAWTPEGSPVLYKCNTILKKFNLNLKKVLRFDYGVFTSDDEYFFTKFRWSNEGNFWLDCEIQKEEGAPCIYIRGKSEYDYGANNYMKINCYIEFTLK